jgi:YD repeat-containing protein
MRLLKNRRTLALSILTAVIVATSAHAVPGENNPKRPTNGPAGVQEPGGFTVNGVSNTFSAGMLNVPGVRQLPQGWSLVGDHAQLFIINSKTPSNVGCAGDKSGGGNNVGKPIQVSTGTKYETYPIFAMPGEMGLTYVLYYNTSLHNGLGWADNLTYDMDLMCSTSTGNGACTYVTYTRPDGSSLVFDGWPGIGPFTERGGGGLATLTYNSATDTYTVHDEDATVKTFNNGQITSTTDPSGIGWTFTYSNNGNGVATTTVTHTNGQSFTVTSGPNVATWPNGVVSNSLPITVTDPGGNVYSLHSTNSLYDQISLPGAPATVISFKYINLKASRLTEVDYNGVPYDYTSYITSAMDPHYQWANGNYLADNSEGVYITYGTDSAGNLQATLTNSLGHQTTQSYDGTNGSGGSNNGQLTLISDSAVSTCAATTHGRSYDANGNLSETIDNNGNVHTYNYAVNGQLQSETEAYGTPLARTTDYIWDSNQQLNRLLSETVEGWNKTTYTYNAQNRLASIAVTNLSGNGSANQTLTTTYNYVLYGNGMVQTMTVTKPSPNGSDTDTYQYDTLGNLTSLSNGLGQTAAYSNYNALGKVGHVVGPNGDATDYTYDARGRVAAKTIYPNGSAATWTYTYDGFGLLYTQTGPDGQVTTWNRDPSSMRVTSVTHNDKDGTSTENFSYDANGDVLEDKVVRGSSVGLDQVFHYDALGRVYQKIGQNGQSLTYAYDGNGNPLSVADATGHTIAYQYDTLNRVTQKSESGGASPAMPTTAPTINVPSSSSTGAYTVSWGSVTGATYYVLQEQVGSGAWAVAQSSASLSWSPTGKPNNSYTYRVEACNSTGCGPWSSTGSVTVSIPSAPVSAPGLTVSGNSANGNYTVSWTAVADTSTYTLQEQVNGGSWTTIQNNSALSWSVTGRTNGTYAYRSQACNGIGCGPWSNTGTMVVSWPPIAPTPSLSAPSNNYTGSYTVSWNATSGAATYWLTYQVNGGAWTAIPNVGSALSWNASGQGNGVYTYAVAACNISGCSATSNQVTTTVTIPTPIAINGQTYVGSITISSGSNSTGIGFDIVNGNTWEVFQTTPANNHAVKTSGSMPYRASTVQYTWTDEGVPAGMNNAGGSVVSNQASSPVAVSSNPSTEYITGSISAKSGNNAHQWGLRVDFFDAQGHNVSSSSCTLIGEVSGNQ